MQVNARQLQQSLKKELNPIYHIMGDDVLLQNESRDLIISSAKKTGALRSDLHIVTQDFDWQWFADFLWQQSLFDDNVVVDLRHPTGKFDKKSSEILKKYFANPSSSKTLVITTNKLTKAQLSTKFYKELDKHAVTIKLWPIVGAEFSKWIVAKLQQVNLSADMQAIKLLSEYTEGNLLAARQAIDMLGLLHSGQKITCAIMQEVVTQSSRYSIYDLTNAALSQNCPHALQILRRLQSIGVDPILILWSITREVRSLLSMACKLEQGCSLSSVLSSVWKSQSQLYQKALRTLNVVDLQLMLQQAFDLDLIIKGRKTGDFWQSCSLLLLSLSGRS